MSTGSNDTIEKLRLIDSVVDFARGYVQLSVILTAIDEERIIPDYTAEKLKLSRKSVIDAIQKLKRKGLLYKEKGNIYILTDKGKKFFKLLSETISALSLTNPVEKIMESYRISEAILVTGTSTKEWVDIRTVAKYLDFDPEQLEKLIETKASNLFKMRKVAGNTFLALTYEGSELYDLLLESIKLGPLTAKTLALLTGTLDPRNALRRFMIVYLLVSILVFLELTRPPYGIIPAIVWAAASSYLAFLIYSKK